MYPASIKPDQPSLDRRRRPGELSIPARYASIQRVPTGIRAVSDPQLVGHRLAMELFENPRGGYPGGSVLGPTNEGEGYQRRGSAFRDRAGNTLRASAPLPVKSADRSTWAGQRIANCGR